MTRVKRKFAEWCGLDDQQFSGSWDLGHLLQLVYGDTLKKNSDVKEFNAKMYELMSSWKTGLAFSRPSQ